MPGVGRIPAAHYLTPHGAKVLADALGCELGEIPYPKRAVMVRHGYLHRPHTVDCEIAVRTWAQANGHSVDWLSSYFDVTGANRAKALPRRRACTKIDLADGTGIIPDCVFHLTDPDGTPRLFVLEMYNQHRTKRMADKLAEYRYAIGEGAIERQFGYLRDIPEHEFRAAVLDYLLDGTTAGLDAIKAKIDAIKADIPKPVA